MSTTSTPPHDPSTSSPSARLLGAALAGLLGVGAAACGDDGNVDPDPDERPDASVDAAEIDAEPPPDAPPDAPPSKIISEENVVKTFAELTADCDARGGFVELHAACGGVNTCAGFSYGDWGPGSVLTEHTCNAVNGCNGLSCVELPADGGKTAVEILTEDLPEGGPGPCKNCHGTVNEQGEFSGEFKVYVHPGSGRTIDNWRDLPAAAQARITAFGKKGTLADGRAYSNMAAYYKVYSRAEIERVVTYLRDEPTLTIVIEEMKTDDPPPP